MPDERVHNVYDESGARSNKETTLLLRGGEILWCMVGLIRYVPGFLVEGFGFGLQASTAW